MSRTFVADATPELWSKAWCAQSCAAQQAANALIDLLAWFNGAKHEAFDAYASHLLFCKPLPTSVLEIGCGAGYYQAVTARLLPSSLFYGIDVSQALIECAKRDYPRGVFDVGTAESLPYANGQFDMTVLGSVLGCCDDWLKAIEEAFRVSGRYVMLHRMAMHNNPTWPDVMNSVKTAYDVRMAERIFSQKVIMKKLKQHGVRAGNSLTWDQSSEGFQASYLFEKYKT
ncbi:MAG: class I SAM-dependent methyltransferase [Bacteroidota bacterium]